MLKKARKEREGGGGGGGERVIRVLWVSAATQCRVDCGTVLIQTGKRNERAMRLGFLVLVKVTVAALHITTASDPFHSSKRI